MKTRAVITAIVIATLLALLSASAVSALQGTPAPVQPSGLTIQIGLDLVQIDAAITDKKGRPITDLRAEEFKLEVDGERLPVTNAAFFGVRSSTGTPDAVDSASRDPLADQTVVFIIDDLNMSFASMYATRRHLERFADSWGEIGARAALRVTSDETGHYSLFTSADRFASVAAALRYNIRSSQGIASTPRMGEGYPQTAARGTSIANVMTEPLGSNPAIDRANLQQRVDTLVSTIDSLRALPGRKAVVFVSEGFYVADETHRQLGTTSPFGSLFDDGDIRAALRMITEVANRASVVVYAVDPRGLMIDGPTVANNLTPKQASDYTRTAVSARLGSQASLQWLAEDTGGLAVINTNDLGDGFNEVVRAQSAYYLLGFEPPAKTFARGASGRPKFHKIKLSIDRPGVRVRTRAGFYGVTDKEVIERAPLTATPTTY